MPLYQQIKDLQTLLELTFGTHIPPFILHIVYWGFLIFVLLSGLYAFLLLIGKIKDVWVQSFWPLFYKQDEKQRSINRQRFAEHVESEIIRVGRQEDWKDYRFTELEAEVEVEGERRIRSWLPFVQRTTSGLRREKSLSKAIETSRERLILVEGEPGSGKSVALRHVTQKMAARAKKSKSTSCIIPLYINLKDLKRDPCEVIDRTLIEAFVLSSLKRINDRDIDVFLENEFHQGLKQGTWLFLFDSFDEIPEILSSTKSDDTIKQYGNALDDFLHGMNCCRGIIASRWFHGPVYLDWRAKFTIQALTKMRQHQLIRKANFKRDAESTFLGQLETSADEIQLLAKNPLFLNLLCEHVKHGFPFPSSAHTLFESYIGTRFTRDEERVRQRFQLESSYIRSVAEKIAFCMTYDSSLGLSATRHELKQSFVRLYAMHAVDIEPALDALIYMKLAREEDSLKATGDKYFTFKHRRFQEYFATCFVLQNPELVSPHDLLSDARWRETAVTLCQVQPLQSLSSIIEYADILLGEYCNILQMHLKELHPEEKGQQESKTEAESQASLNILFSEFPYLTEALHLLKILQEGFVNRFEELPAKIRSYVGEIVLTATNMAPLSERKLALEVVGPAPEEIRTQILTQAFTSGSELLRSVAYQQVTHQQVLSPEIEEGIVNALLDLRQKGSIYSLKDATRAHLMRLSHPEKFLTLLDQLVYLPRFDRVIWIINSLILLIGMYHFMAVAIPILGKKSLYIICMLICIMMLSYIQINIVYLKEKRKSEVLTILACIGTRILLNLIIYVEIVYMVLPLYFRLFLDMLDLALAYTALVYPFFLLLLINDVRVTKKQIFFTPLSAFLPVLKFFLPHNFFPFCKKYLFTISVVAVFLSASVAIVVFISKVVPLDWILAVILTPTSIIVLLFTCFIAIKTGKVWSFRLKDFIKWRKYFAHRKQPFTHLEFGEATSYYFSSNILQAVSRIGRKQFLETTEEVEKLLKKIAFSIEQNQRISNSTKHTSPLIVVKDNTDDEEVEGFASCAHLSASYDPVLLDEIYRILEDINKKRQKMVL